MKMIKYTLLISESDFDFIPSGSTFFTNMEEMDNFIDENISSGTPTGWVCCLCGRSAVNRLDIKRHIESKHCGTPGFRWSMLFCFSPRDFNKIYLVVTWLVAMPNYTRPDIAWQLIRDSNTTLLSPTQGSILYITQTNIQKYTIWYFKVNKFDNLCPICVLLKSNAVFL